MSAVAASPRAAPASPRSLETAVAEFGQFAYQQRPFAARNWGHPLHSLCSYPSKLKPGLAYFLIRAFTDPGDIVLDPFSGVGTIPFEACSQGRRGIGADLSPFAYTITSAKLAPSRPSALSKALARFNDLLSVTAESLDVSTVPAEIREFFHPDTCREVAAARAVLVGTAFGKTRGGRAITAALCHVLHGNRPYALSRRSHGIIPIPPKGDFVYKPVFPAVADKLARAKFDSVPESFVPGEAYLADAFSLGRRLPMADAIITSPPFLGTTEFLRQNRVRLWFCGMDYSAQQTEKARFVEHRRDLAFYRPLLAEWRRVLRPGGLLVMHLGVVKKRDMALEIEPHAEAAGFRVHSILYEPVNHLESHGRTDRGATHTHQFLIATSRLTSVG